jgi:hypothetical protein
MFVVQASACPALELHGSNRRAKARTTNADRFKAPPKSRLAKPESGLSRRAVKPPVKHGFLYRIYVDGHLDAERLGEWGIEAAAEGEWILKIAYPNQSAADRELWQNDLIDGGDQRINRSGS